MQRIETSRPLACYLITTYTRNIAQGSQ